MNLRTETVSTVLFGLGFNVVVPIIPDQAPQHVREGLARQRLLLLTGQCPCGVRLTGPNRAQRRQMARDEHRGIGVWEVTPSHFAGCPATHPDITGETP